MTPPPNHTAKVEGASPAAEAAPASAKTSATPDASWGVPLPAVIPPPTYFPAVTAFGITVFLWGFVTSPVILLIGFVVLVVALVGWMGDIRRDK